MTHFKETLLRLMKQRGQTVSSIARAIGVPKSTISEWCSGRTPLMDTAVVKLARHLGVSVEHLISGQEPEPDLLNRVIDELGDGFVTLHTGVYRLRVEKFVGNKKG